MTAQQELIRILTEKLGYYGREQWIAINWSARCSAFLSIIGSSTILFMILRRRKIRMALVHNRIIFAMSIIDIFSSLTWTLGPLVAPSELNGVSIYGARGNDTTCTIQGFVFTVGFAVPLYNSCLALVYLAVIRYNTSDDVLLKREKFMHIFALGVALSIAIFGAVTHSYKSDGIGICWFVNGLGAGSIIGRKFIIGFVVLYFLTTIGSMALIYQAVRAQSEVMDKYERLSRTKPHSRQNDLAIEDEENNDDDGNVASNENQDEATTSERHTQGNLDAKKDTAHQAYLFVGAFLSTYFFSIIDIFIPGRHFVISILISIFYPLQGFWNFIIYVRPKCVNLQKRNGSKPFRWIIFKAIFSSVEEEEQNKKKDAMKRSFLLKKRKRNRGSNQTSTHSNCATSNARSSGGRDISRLKAIMGETRNTTPDDVASSLEKGDKLNQQENQKLTSDSDFGDFEHEQLMHESNGSIENVAIVFSD